MGKKYEFTEEEIKKIKKARKKNHDKNIENRLKVLELRATGKTQVETSAATGYNRGYISKVVKKYKENGLEWFTEKHYKGNHRNLSFEEEEELLNEFKEAAEKGHILIVEDIAKKYEEKVGHKISSGQIYRVLKRHGWRKIMPRAKHPKSAGLEAIEASKKLTQQSVERLTL